MYLDQILQGVVLITGIAGQILVAYRNPNGFYWWLICNVAALTISVWNQLYGMAGLYVFYSFMCFYSLWKWKRLEDIK